MLKVDRLKIKEYNTPILVMYKCCVVTSIYFVVWKAKFIYINHLLL